MFVVYNIDSLRNETFQSLGGAKRSTTVKNRKARLAGGKDPQFAWTTREDFNENVNTMTTTYNMLDPQRRPIPIRKADKGGCCDPATETYHSM